ncbi:MAG TPA: prolyl oligopeptidase family serine peptidase [Terriglobales bacterium]|jgi:hypothetical protein|nr:prolyl oligopeptidase family serine peptidase [Terriglobales bacterium]
MKSVIVCPAVVIVALLLMVSVGDGQVRSHREPDPSAPSSGSVEDFSVPSLSQSQLHADAPELVEKSEGTGFTREFYSVEWRPGDNIDLYIIRPTNIQKPPVAIYLYGHPSETDRYQDDGWCQRVTAGGYSAVGFVPALTGHRYHSRPMKQWFVSELQEALGKSTHDVQMVLNYLSTRGDVDMDNVGIFGVGAGGTIAVAAASVDSRIKAIDLLDPWGDWPEWMAKSQVVPEEERAGFVKPEFLKKIAPFDPVAILPTLKTAHIRLIQLNEDFVSTPEEAKKKIEAAIPAGAEKRRYESNAEFFGAVASGGRAFDWLKLQLKATESKEATAKSIGGASSRENQQEFQTK